MSDADIELGNIPLLSHSEQLSVKIKYQNKDYEVNVSAKDAVSDLIIKFKQLLPPQDTQNKNVRLIYSGKLLAPPRYTYSLAYSLAYLLTNLLPCLLTLLLIRSTLLSNFKIVDGSFIHAVVNDIPGSSSAPAASVISNSSLIVGGFDVLLADGLAVYEVAAIRYTLSYSTHLLLNIY